jgi:hypothetical protein
VDTISRFECLIPPVQSGKAEEYVLECNANGASTIQVSVQPSAAFSVSPTTIAVQAGHNSLIAMISVTRNTPTGPKHAIISCDLGADRRSTVVVVQ